MKKIFKNLATLLIMASLACGVAFGFAACGNGDKGGDEGGTEQGGNEQGGTEQGGSEQGGNEQGGETQAQEYIFEAEYVDLTGVSGTGISGSASETEMITYDKYASNSYAVGFTHRSGITLKFNFTSDAAGKATLTLKLGNESVPLPLNSDNLIIKVNGTEINYDVGSIPSNSSPKHNDYHDFEIGEIDVVEGDNTIELIVGENTLMNGSTQGPIFDAIVLESEATLVFDAHEDNLDEV